MSFRGFEIGQEQHSYLTEARWLREDHAREIPADEVCPTAGCGDRSERSEDDAG